MDANARVGWVRENGISMVLDPEVVGDFSREREHANGKLLRETLALLEFMLVNTFLDLGPTLYGPVAGRFSRCDYIATHQSANARIRTCRLWEHSARKLQLIRDWRPRDHIPIMLDLFVDLAHSGPGPKYIQWEWSKISGAILLGRGREDLFPRPVWYLGTWTMTGMLLECFPDRTIPGICLITRLGLLLSSTSAELLTIIPLKAPIILKSSANEWTLVSNLHVPLFLFPVFVPRSLWLGGPKLRFLKWIGGFGKGLKLNVLPNKNYLIFRFWKLLWRKMIIWFTCVLVPVLVPMSVQSVVTTGRRRQRDTLLRHGTPNWHPLVLKVAVMLDPSVFVKNATIQYLYGELWVVIVIFFMLLLRGKPLYNLLQLKGVYVDTPRRFLLILLAAPLALISTMKVPF